jgi:hypothetical protein
MSNLNSFAPLNYDIDIDVPIVKATSNPLRKYKKKLRNLEHRQKKKNTREICDAIKSLKKRIYRLENPNKHLPIKKKIKKKKLQRKKMKNNTNDIQLSFDTLPIHVRNGIFRNYVYNKALVENYKKIIKSDYKETILHLKYKRLNK